MRNKKAFLTILAATIIISTIILWAWHKNNWWLLLGIPFSLFFFTNAQATGNSLGYVLTFVILHVIYTAVTGNFEFAVWSWFFFYCGIMSYASACFIYGSEQSNWEKQAKNIGDDRTFEEYKRDEFLSNSEIKEMMQKINNRGKNNQ